jgi:hypothetical protein
MGAENSFAPHLHGKKILCVTCSLGGLTEDELQSGDPAYPFLPARRWIIHK